MNKNKKKTHNICDIPLSPDNNKLPKSLQLTQGWNILSEWHFEPIKQN